MKKKNVLLFFLVSVLMLFSTSLFAQSHTIISLDEIQSFTDPNIPMTWLEPVIDGSLILSWDEGVVGILGGFCDLTIYTPVPNGGKYEISLMMVTSSNATQITGIWSIKKNNGPQTLMTGTASNLNVPTPFITPITISIGGYQAVIKLTDSFIGLKGEINEVSGQIFADGTPIAGATVRMKEDANPLEVLTTDSEGKYKYINVASADFKRVVTVFKNYDSNVVLEGYVFVGGVPLVGASVTIDQPQSSTVLDTTVTDANGHYISTNIIGYNGVNIRTTIKP